MGLVGDITRDEESDRASRLIKGLTIHFKGRCLWASIQWEMTIWLGIWSSNKSLKIIEKVSFNIASEASYGYILSWQKFIKNTKNRQFGEFLVKHKQCYQISQFQLYKNWWKMPKLITLGETFWVTFKHYVSDMEENHKIATLITKTGQIIWGP